MAPLVIVENGSLVPNANSFATRDTVAAYCDNRGYAFSISDTAAADRAIIRAGDWMKNTRRIMYRGALIGATQAMPWPRQDASFYRGPAIATNVVPQCVIDAQCELAYRTLAGTDLQPDLDRGGQIKSEKVGPFETEYFPGAPPEIVIQAVLGILAPVLLDPGTVIPLPYQAQPTDKVPYQSGEFDNPPISYTSDPPAVS